MPLSLWGIQIKCKENVLQPHKNRVIDLKIISSKHSFGNFSPNSASNAIFWKISVVTSVMLVINPMKRRRWASIPFIPIPLMRGLYTTFQKILEYRSYGLPLFRKKSLERNEMFQGNTSKFAIFYVGSIRKPTKYFFFFILCNFFTFSLYEFPALCQQRSGHS